MKEQKCNNCQNNPAHRCSVCGNEHKDSSQMAIHSNLYAAEFLLYAFHFEDHDRETRSKSTSAHPLMMMVTEG